ncbi:VID27 cytoplasmic protein-domain-containing protein [Scheffersomyces amazonensis]|uniref:VID27 cytoplasmic protein-domain-containing protein n=1 Tax=Scheffersomyces amazonensis TaxID=1078765 RepID=UPI00315D53F2
MNFIRKFIGTSTTDEIAQIPSGRLYLTRSPQSPKGEIECLYNDAFASIKQTTRPYFYQLCITRVYQEGELDAHGSSGFDDSDEDDEDDHDGPHSIADTSGSAHSKDEWAFTILEDLKFHTYDKSDGTKAIVWKDLNGDLGDKFEFIIDEDVKAKDVDSFMFALYKCLYESKYHKSSLAIQDINQLKEFFYNPKSELLTFDDLKSPNILQYGLDEDEDDDDEEEDEEEDDPEDADNDEFMDAVSESALPSHFPISLDPPVEPHGRPIYENGSFELFLYDSEAGVFKPQLESSEVEAKIIALNDWEYTLYVHSKTAKLNIHFNASISKNMSPSFNYENLSFIFNYFHVQGDSEIAAYSCMFKFGTYNELALFQKVFLSSMWETLNKSKWDKTDTSDKDYVSDAFSNLRISDDVQENAEDSEEEEEEEEPETSRSKSVKSKTLFVNEDDDEDEFGDNEQEKDHKTFKSSTDKNSNLSVGYANNKSFVARGNKLGVFNSYNDGLAYQTTISDVKDLKGKSFIPEKMILHQQDQVMVMSNRQHNDKVLYKMDLNRGKIVEEWEIDEKNPIVSYGPNTKFAQLTNDPILTGISENGLFNIDPRLSGYKLVNDNTYKSYKTTNNKFSTFATTEQGYIAVGSGKGDIRLYDRLGVNAKSALPSLGEPIKGIDVSKDGRWLLATCETYLLLIDTKIGSNQKNAGNLGFTKYFDKDKKPTPRRLAIKTEHAAYIAADTHGKPLSFTQARFNAGLNSKETSIVTSSGPYVISWSLRKVLSGAEEPYTIKKYKQTIIADNFKFGSNSDVIIALQDDVAMTNRQRLDHANKVLKRTTVKPFF